MMASNASLADMTVTQVTAALAAATPTPGGGSAAALAGALGASLVAMVARLSQGRPRYEAHAERHAAALEAAEAARVRMLELMDEDARAYAAFREARQMPHATDAEAGARDDASRIAARHATSVPLAVVQTCHGLIDTTEGMVGRSNASAASDLEVAALLIECAARGAAENALVNLPAVGDDGFAVAVTSEVAERLRQIEGATARIRERVLAGVAAEPSVT
jgi:formiminotetrahydrofolate cyclodeaminase